MTIRIDGLDHIVLRIKSLPPMLQFYGEVMGFRLERQLPQLGLYQLRAGASLIDLVPYDSPLGKEGGQQPDSQHRNLDHFCLAVTDFDEATLRQHFAKYDIELGPVEQRYGTKGTGPSMYLADPEGNVIELKGPPHQSPDV